MSVDEATVRRVARLARIAVPESEVPGLQAELNGILDWVAQLDEVEIEGVEPMTSVVAVSMKKREDRVVDGHYPEKILANAPLTEDGFFLVPKVVE